MRASKPLLALAALLAVTAGRPVSADTPLEASRSGAVDLMDDLWTLVTDVSTRVGLQDPASKTGPRPQAIPGGGPSIDVSNLTQPTDIEDQIRRALQSEGQLRLTIPGGTARGGNYSLGSEECLDGHLLVVTLQRRQSLVPRHPAEPGLAPAPEKPRRGRVKCIVWDLDNDGVDELVLDLAQRSLKENRARVEIGTMAPLDIVQAEAEVATREESVILAEAAIEKVPVEIACETVEHAFHAGKHALDLQHVAARENVRQSGRRGDLLHVIFGGLR